MSPEMAGSTVSECIAPRSVELIDGDDLCELLKKYELGVRTRQVEEADVETGFFAQFEDP